MARPREYDDDLRVRLIEAAARVLAEEGPAAMTTRRIAAEVGTSTTAIYSLIGSKDDLLAAIAHEGFRRLAEHLATVTPSDDPLADIGEMGLAYHDMAVESPELYAVMFSGKHLEVVDEAEAAYSLATLQTLIDAVQRAIDAGQLDGDANDVALRMWGLNHGITSLTIAGMMGPPEDARRLVMVAGLDLVAGLRADREVSRSRGR